MGEGDNEETLINIERLDKANRPSSTPRQDQNYEQTINNDNENDHYSFRLQG